MEARDRGLTREQMARLIDNNESAAKLGLNVLQDQLRELQLIFSKENLKKFINSALTVSAPITVQQSLKKAHK